jgi:hypothetical protein
MTRAIKGTLARTSAVERTVIRYPVIWAHDETEVPPWDPVRGGVIGAVFETEAERGDRPLRGWEIGPSKPPPPSGSVFPSYYPRLTRATPFKPDKKLPKLVPKDLVCQEIAQLAKHLENSKKFKKEVLKIATKYGPLIPGESASWEWDTLRAWKRVSKEMDFNLKLVKSVKDHSEKLDRVTREDRETDERRERRQLIKNAPEEMSGLITNFTDTGPFGNKVPMVDLPLQEYQAALGRYFWELFSMHSYRSATLNVRTPGRVHVECGSYAWAYKELWELLTSSQHVLFCDRCGSSFVAVRSDARTCSVACKKALQRQREKKHAAI